MKQMNGGHVNRKKKWFFSPLSTFIYAGLPWEHTEKEISSLIKLGFIPHQNLLDYFLLPEVIKGLEDVADCPVVEILSEFWEFHHQKMLKELKSEFSIFKQ